MLKSIAVSEIMTKGRPFVSFRPGTPGGEMLRQTADAGWQDVFPVLDAAGKELSLDSIGSAVRYGSVPMR